MIGIRDPVILRIYPKIGYLNFLIQKPWVAQRSIDVPGVIMSSETVEFILGRIAKDHFALQHKIVMLISPVQASAEDLEFLFVQFPGMYVKLPDGSSPPQVIHDIIRPLKIVLPRPGRVEETVNHSVRHEGVQREKLLVNSQQLVQGTVSVSHLCLRPAGDRE